MDRLSYISAFIIGAGILQGVFQAAVLLRIQRGNRTANRILAFLLFSFSLNITHSFFFADILAPSITRTLKINEPFQFLLGPLMYLYVVQLTQPATRLQKSDYLHFIPFLVYCFTVLPMTSIFRNTSAGLFIDKHAYSLTITVWCVIILHLSVYVIHSHIKLIQHQRNIKDCFSDIDRISLHWLKYFVSLLFGIYAVYFLLLAGLLHLQDIERLFPHFHKTVSLVLSFGVYGLGYRGLQQPEIFIGIEQPQIKTTAPKYEHSSLDDCETEKTVEMLLSLMEGEKPFLNPELTLPELASMVDISRNRLSQLLNEKLGVNFYDFINAYRVKEVQKLMSDPGYQQMTLLAIAFDAGFNSKATFNSMFKKITGVTPSEYRKKNESGSNPDSITQQF